MSFKENTNYYKEMKVPVKILKNKERISDKNPKETNLGRVSYFLKKAGYLVLIIALISSQVYLLSAFEAHIINVTARICDLSETRTMGFWKNHFNVYKNCLYPEYNLYLGDYPDDLNIESKDQVNDIFEDANADVMRDMLKGQLLAMKFNICAFGIDPYDGEEFDLFDGEKTLAEIVDAADQLLREDPEPPREKLELVKNLLDDLNNRPEIKYCSTSPSWLNNVLADKSDKPDKPGKPDKGVTEVATIDDTFLQASLIDGIDINSLDTTTPDEDGINISSSDTTTPSEDGIVNGG